jgi:hypothetical protein
VSDGTWANDNYTVALKANNAAVTFSKPIVRSGGTSSQFLKADGSLDSNTYLTEGAQGPTGAQGIQGVQGTTGIQGTTGATGAQGMTGTTGLQGLTGAQGITGSQGTTGTQGLTGAQGIEGIQGTEGLQGIQGTEGPVAASANQVVYKNASNVATGSSTFTFDGTALTADSLRLTSIADVTLTSTTHAFQIGPSNAANLRIDQNEIEAQNNEAAATLVLNASGGTVQFGGLLDSNDTYANDITTTRRAMWMSSAGVFGYASSSRTKKQDIVPANIDVDAVLSIEPKLFRYIKAVEEMGDDAPIEAGMIAEDLHDAGLTHFVDYGKDGTIQGIHYSTYVTALQVVVRDLSARLKEVTDRLDRLEGQ